MSEFKSSYEQNKWDSIAKSSSGSLNKLKAGKASNADLKNISDVIGRYDKLAKNVFDQGVQAIESSAQNLIDSIKQDRERKGKAPLTAAQAEKLYEQAIKREIDDFGPELVETIQAMLDKKFDALTEQTRRMSDSFKNVTNFLGDEHQKPLTAQDYEHLDSKSYRDERMYEENRWKIRLNQLSHMMRDTVEDTFLDIFARFTGKDVTPSNNLAAAGRSYTPNALANAISGMQDAANDSTNPEASGTQPMPLSSKQEDAIVQNQKANNTDLVDKFRKTLTDLLDTSDDKEERMEKRKADTWWRSFKGWVGDKKDKVKKSFTDGWLGTILKGLGIALLAPQLFDTLAEKVKSIFTWDNITNAGKYVLDQIVDKGPDVLKWIGNVVAAGAKQLWEWLNKGFSWVIDKIRSWLPKALGGYSDEEKKAKAASVAAGPLGASGPTTPAATSSNSTAPAASPAKAAEIVPTKDVSSTIANAMPSDSSSSSSSAQPTEATYNIEGSTALVNKGGDTTTVAGDSTTVKQNNRSTIAPVVSSSETNTQTVAESQVEDKPGAVTQPPGAAAASNAVASAPATDSSGKVGLGSFSITSATDDSLLLMNAGMIA